MKEQQTLKIAVVGHANTGKTSLLQTLLRRRDFGVVSPRGGTTRTVEVGEIHDEHGPLVSILDTPGLEDSLRLRDAIEACREGRHDDPRTLLDRFLATPAARDEHDLALEAESIRAAISADVLLYTIDVRDQPRPRHLDELVVLASTARPLVPVLNFIARPEADAGRWRDACARQGLHATVAYDAVVFDDAGERRLLEAIRALAPTHDAAIDRWIAWRLAGRKTAIESAIEVAAELIVDAASATVITDSPDTAAEDAEIARREAFDAGVQRLLTRTREREAESRTMIAACFGFSGDEATATSLEIVEALGGVDFASPASLERAGLWAAGTGAGLVAAGAMVDLATGGVSLGGFTALGTLGAALGVAGASSRKLLRRWRGQDEVRLGDAATRLLAIRALATIRAFLARGHAAIEPTSIDSGIRRGLADQEIDDAFIRDCRAARGRPDWSPLSLPEPTTGPGPARAEVVQNVASSLQRTFNQTITD